LRSLRLEAAHAALTAAFLLLTAAAGVSELICKV
jgi:hypothetical protein